MVAALLQPVHVQLQSAPCQPDARGQRLQPVAALNGPRSGLFG